MLSYHPQVAIGLIVTCIQPFTAALDLDITTSYNVFKYYAGAADKICGQTIETSASKLTYVLQEPIGVCGQIIPWYFSPFKDQIRW